MALCPNAAVPVLSYCFLRPWSQAYVAFVDDAFEWFAQQLDGCLQVHALGPCSDKRPAFAGVGHHVRLTTGSYCFWNPRLRQIHLDTSGTCGNRHAVIAHEIMHALGFAHEHTRADRDQHVAVRWENIDTRSRTDFELPNGHHHDAMHGNTSGAELWPYDTDSLMHYGGANGRRRGATGPTLVRKDGEQLATIGQKLWFSATDVHRLTSRLCSEAYVSPARTVVLARRTECRGWVRHDERSSTDRCTALGAAHAVDDHCCLAGAGYWTWPQSARRVMHDE